MGELPVRAYITGFVRLFVLSVHSCLCVAHAAAWQAREQYGMVWHLPQIFMGFANIPQCAHKFPRLDRLRLRGFMYFMARLGRLVVVVAMSV